MRMIFEVEGFQLFFAWYDLWVGAYWKSDRRRLYLCPLPMVCMMIQFKLRPIDQLKLQLEPSNRWVEFPLEDDDA